MKKHSEPPLGVDQRSEVRRRLAKHPDRKFRRAVFALQLLYQPDPDGVLLRTVVGSSKG